MAIPTQLDRHHLTLYGVLAGLLALGIGVTVWLERGQDIAELKGKIAASEQIVAAKQVIIDQQTVVIADARQMMTALEQRITQRDALLERAIAQLDRVKRETQTPEQVVRAIPQYLPGVPTPPRLEQRAAEPPVLVFPNEDIKPLFDLVVQAEADRAALSTARQTIVDLRTKDVKREETEAALNVQLAALGEQLKQTRKERDDAITAAKGGSFWRRFGRTAKAVGVGVVIGVAIAVGVGH